MRSIMELSRRTSENATAVTDSVTTGITDTRPQVWKTEVIKWSETMRRLEQFVRVDKTLVGKPGQTVTFIKSTSHLSIDTAPSSGEGDERDITEMTNLDTVDVTVAAADFLLGEIRISKQIRLTSSIDLVKQARYSIAQDLADDVDLKLASANGYQDTSITNEIFGGASANADASDLATGDVFTVDMIPDARAMMKVNNWRPKALVVGPYQEATMLKDPQFTNASEYGSNRIVLKGEIGEYLGLQIIETSNANLTYGSSDTDIHDTTSWGAAGFTSVMIGQNQDGEWPVALVWKELPHIDMEEDKGKASWRVYYDQAFESGMIQIEGVVLIKTTNA